MREPTRWIGWVKLSTGWLKVCQSYDYANAWAELKAAHPELNARLKVLRSGEDPDKISQ